MALHGDESYHAQHHDHLLSSGYSHILPPSWLEEQLGRGRKLYIYGKAVAAVW
jgi:hypothetical protein